MTRSMTINTGLLRMKIWIRQWLEDRTGRPQTLLSTKLNSVKTSQRKDSVITTKSASLPTAIMNSHGMRKDWPKCQRRAIGLRDVRISGRLANASTVSDANLVITKLAAKHLTCLKFSKQFAKQLSSGQWSHTSLNCSSDCTRATMESSAPRTSEFYLYYIFWIWTTSGFRRRGCTWNIFWEFVISVQIVIKWQLLCFYIEKAMWLLSGWLLYSLTGINSNISKIIIIHTWSSITTWFPTSIWESTGRGTSQSGSTKQAGRDADSLQGEKRLLWLHLDQLILWGHWFMVRPSDITTRQERAEVPTVFYCRFHLGGSQGCRSGCRICQIDWHLCRPQKKEQKSRVDWR